MLLTDEELVNRIWHDKVEDGSSWRFCAGLLSDQNIKITHTTLKRKFVSFFENTTGINPYAKCPECKSELLPRKSQYGYFVGCSRYPKCRFMATSTKPYRPK